MGVLEASEGGIGAGECSVGTIVWVRRRNGSWWPGRILGQEELSASHLMSPRSGTPVKLLGREDASVDWYNLEKSKRVKAFRCGEFDSCIERAENSQSAPIKKREKYARREDAILHALELEKKNLDKRQQNCESTINTNSEVTKKEQDVGISSGDQMKNDGSGNHSRFAPKPQLLSRKDSKHSSREDNTPETTPRMRGLQDFGLRSFQSKRKFDVSIANDSGQGYSLVDSHGRAFPGSMQGMEGRTNVMNTKSYVPFKKRQLQVGVNEEFLNKRRDRRRPLLQVLQSTAKLSTSKSLSSAGVSIPVNPERNIEHTSALSNAERSSKDNSLDPNNSLDHTGYSSDQMQISPVLPRYPSMNEENTSSGLNEPDESASLEEVHSDEDPDTEDDETLYQGYNQSLPSRSKNPGRFIEDNRFPDQEKYVNLDGNNKSYLSGFTYPQYPHRPTVGTTASNLEVSKWNMKGKRNIRNLTKRPIDEVAGPMYPSLMNGRPYQSKRLAMKSSRGRAIAEGFYQKYDDFYGSEFIEKDLSPQLPYHSNNRLRIKGSLGNQKDGAINDSDEESPGISPSGWEVDSEQFDHYYTGGMDFLYVDVDLKVQTSYQGERVPLVSLMSRLDGKAIVGHPLPVETLEDGSTDAVIARNESGEDRISTDGNETPPPVWTTGRRTAMQRVPRPHPLPEALESKDADELLYSDSDIRPAFKKPYDVHLDNPPMFRKKISSNSQRPVKYQKKPSKKANLSSNQKIRKLSSFTSQQKNSKFSSGKVRGVLDGLIKPEGLVPIVACVPVKVVFSRILEAVGRSSSISTSHRVSLAVSLEKKPL